MHLSFARTSKRLSKRRGLVTKGRDYLGILLICVGCISELLEYEPLENDLLWHLLDKYVEKRKVLFYAEKLGKQSPPFSTPLVRKNFMIENFISTHMYLGD